MDASFETEWLNWKLSKVALPHASDGHDKASCDPCVSAYKQDSHNTPIKFDELSRTAHRPQENMLTGCSSAVGQCSYTL